MITFNAETITDRLIKYLATKTEWSQIISDSAVTSLLGAIAESEAECVRYFEYLLQEAKWGYARNISSLLSQSSFLGYKAKRKISATSENAVVISHDANLSSASVEGWTIDSLSTNLSVYSGSTISIPVGTILKSIDSIEYIVSESLSYPSALYDNKYLIVPVIQGIQRTQQAVALGNPFETIRFTTPDRTIEAASNAISSKFFSVSANISGVTTLLTQYEDIYLADYNELAYDVTTTNDFSSIDIRFGNGIAGAIIPAGSIITVNYLETLGINGNIVENYTLNTLSSSLSTSLYCTNFNSILGGQEEDTVETIRDKAPLEYLINGSIITAEAYETAIKTLPYIHNAKVYSGEYVDPISGTTQMSVIYTAITNEGEAPDSITFQKDVVDLTLGKVSPLDYITYSIPLFLHLKLNLKAKTTDSALTTRQDSIKSQLLTKYGTLQQEFMQTFSKSDTTNYIIQQNTTSANVNMISNPVLLPEAVTTLLPSSFESDSLLDGYYKCNFKFDRSFLRLKGFNDTVQHVLKIQIFFNCVECSYGTNSYSRTLFLIRDTTNTLSTSFTFTLDNAIAGNVTLCTQTVALNAAQVNTPATVATALAATVISGYTLTNPSPGVLQIVKDTDTIPDPTFNGGTTGIIGTAGITIQYKTVQYPYISKITDYNYMQDYVLNTANAPHEILPSDIDTPYIPFYVNFDYYSINPTDLNNIDLGSGSISIPLRLVVTGTPYYINFESADPDVLDANIKIQIIAQPFNTDTITPYYENNLIKVEETGIAETEDVVVELYQ